LETLNVPNEEDAPADAHRSLRTVRWSELDIFDHVNAATYLRFCDDARAAYDLEHDSPAGTLRRPQIGAALHYDRETREGETLEILSWRVAPGRLGFVLRSAEDGSLRSRVLMALAPVTEAAP
jgi:acyl-CoA thioesterase FadM